MPINNWGIAGRKVTVQTDGHTRRLDDPTNNSGFGHASVPPFRAQTSVYWNVRPQGESTSVFWFPPKLDEIRAGKVASPHSEAVEEAAQELSQSTSAIVPKYSGEPGICAFK